MNERPVAGMADRAVDDRIWVGLDLISIVYAPESVLQH